MKLIYEYLLSKSNAKQTVSSAIDELAKELTQSLYEAPTYKSLFNVIKSSKHVDFFETICSIILDFYNEGCEYRILNNGHFDNVTEDFKGFRITSKGLGHRDGISFDIFDVENMVQLNIEIKYDRWIIREGNLPEKDMLIEYLKGRGGILFKVLYLGTKFDQKELNEFKEKLNELIYK